MAATRGLIVLDRDGVLNALWSTTRPSRARTARCARREVAVFPWVPGVLRDLTRAGFGLVIASNQPAAAKGKTTRAELQAVHAAIVLRGDRRAAASS